MGCKYMANCAVYPYQGYYDCSIQESRLIPFIIKLIRIRRQGYDIIDIKYRGC
jgi:hypothetical protein